jgi:diguanylate cyclase (GGDEF)-like protein
VSTAIPKAPPAILIVDDDVTILRALQRELRDQPLRVDVESDPVAALARILPGGYSVIVSDQQMPGMTGIQFLAAVKEIAPFTVRVLLTGLTDGEIVIKAINDGEIHRFISKPWSRGDLLRHLSSAMDRHRELQQRQGLVLALTAQNAELANLNRDLREFALRDRMTDLFNRGEFDLQLQRQIALFRRDRQPFALALGDIDDFKRINDTYGHLVGDEAIRTTAAILRRCLRDELDSPCRYGGEEFAVILRATSGDAAVTPIERILTGIRQSRVVAGDATFGFTMSFGLSQYVPDEPAQALISRVDGLLYRAKREGKNCYRVSTSAC